MTGLLADPRAVLNHKHFRPAWMHARARGPLFTRDDVTLVVAACSGAPNRDPWLALLRLHDGRHALLRVLCRGGLGSDRDGTCSDVGDSALLAPNLNGLLDKGEHTWRRFQNPNLAAFLPLAIDAEPDYVLAASAAVEAHHPEVAWEVYREGLGLPR